MIFDKGNMMRGAIGAAINAYHFFKYLALAIIAALVFWILLTGGGRAEWKPEYANAPQEVRDWYKNAKLTEDAQKRLGWAYCCDHADVVRTKFRVGEAGADVWEWLDGTTWKVIPADIIHGEDRAPGGQPVLFVYNGTPTCFFLPEGGI